MDEPSTPWHAVSADEALAKLSTNGASGLTTPETQRRRVFYGTNSVEYERRFSTVLLFLGQFKNALIIVLLIAVSVSAFLGEILDALVIALIVVLVAFTGFFQEYRAERVFAALRKSLSQTCVAIRDGRRETVPVAEIVPGDVILFETGVRVPADVRLFEVAALQIEESPLTGESTPVVKQVEPVPEGVPVAERTNMAFAGTAITYGRARGVVVATGARTEFGKIIQKTVEVEEEETPLERQVNSIGKKFGVMALGVILVVGLAEFSREGFSGSLSFSGFVAILLFGISLGVAAVPEALPAVITTNLSLGMRIMARNNALVRKMSAVETLGSTEIICFDKTGTLTKGEMTTRVVQAGDDTFQVTGVGYAPEGSITHEGGRLERIPDSLTELGRASLLCNDATLQMDSNGRWEVIGDPSEGALLVLARKIGLDPIVERLPRVAEFPFSSERKMMTTLHRTRDGGLIGFAKGAPENLLPRCAKKLAGNGIEELRAVDRDEVSKAAERLSSSGMRVMALASRKFELEPPNWESDVEGEFVFLGLVGMEDPIRLEAVEAVQRAVKAGMRPIMITGDHRATAVVIAERAGIFRPGDQVLSGSELQGITDVELTDKVQRVTVYARISPLDKLRIVNAWKQRGRVVAMTGDGVNDAPALKRADIGVAMGMSGTDVAKEAADIILTDDNFASMVKAVELGRWIYDNIRKYLAYLLQANLVEIAVLGSIALIVGPLVGLEGTALPLLPVQILYINLATDGLPALALGFSPVDSDLLRKPPRPRDEPVFTSNLKRFLVSTLLVQVPVLLLGFTTGLASGIDVARTRLFLMFVFMELALAINCRSLSVTLRKAKPHFWLLLSVAWEALLVFALLQFPQSRDALQIVIPRTEDLFWILGGIMLTFAGCEMLKNLNARNSRVPRGSVKDLD